MNHEAPGMPEALVWFSILLLALCVWLWVRLPFTGVRIDGDEAVVTSWWSRRRFARSSIARFRAESYGGFFFLLGWAISDGRFVSAHLTIDLTDGMEATLGGTVSNRRITREIAESLNGWLGLEVGAGTGPRRQAKARRRSASQADRPSAGD